MSPDLPLEGRTTNFHLEETAKPYIYLQHSRKKSIRQQRFDGLDRNLVWWIHRPPCLLQKPYDCFAFPARSRHALLAKDLVTWQAMVGRHILEDIVERVAQYVDEHYPVDKWHLGDLIAWVAQSALKYRPRICELSKCLEGPLKMIVCPKKLLPTLSHLVKLLYAARQ
ncbi:hypothetical protein TNCV_32671 [Trichonephila clavipes]|nr:hypothetical protein TNCV_32671 [Trichonephila clavipes]